MIVGIVISPNPEKNDLPLRQQLPEPMFYEQLYEAAHNMTLYVFNANSYQKESDRLLGYQFINGRWTKAEVDFPHIIIDRTFHPSPLHVRIHANFMKQLQARRPFLYLNSQLPHKQIVYTMLQTKFPSYIPPTVSLDHFSTLEHWLEHYKNGIILKPQAGMQGKGIIHIVKQDSQYSINGRKANNQPVRTQLSNRLTLQKWLIYFRQNTAYLLQPYYELVTAELEPFDIRVLMQKNGDGIWQYSGDVARVGEKHGLTSNLHGGGKSLPTLTLLSAKFGAATANTLLEHIHHLSIRIVEELEACLGRFGELGLDFGITEHKDIIFLECNSKPGRQAFSHDSLLEHKVIKQPLVYARYLFEHYIDHKVTHYKSTSNHH